MEEKKTNNSEVIDLRLVAKKIWANKRLFYKTLPITFVLSCIYIFSLPRYYTSEVKLAPEMENGMGSGTLGSLAASFGIDLSNMQTSDAITPLLYPDLMEDNGFVTSMFNIRVKDIGGEIDATYHDYLKKYQKQAWFSYPIAWLKSLLPKKGETSGSDNGFNPYHLSKQDDDIAGAIRKNVNISIDKRTGVITINTQAQDAVSDDSPCAGILHYFQLHSDAGRLLRVCGLRLRTRDFRQSFCRLPQFPVFHVRRVECACCLPHTEYSPL